MVSSVTSVQTLQWRRCMWARGLEHSGAGWGPCGPCCDCSPQSLPCLLPSLPCPKALPPPRCHMTAIAHSAAFPHWLLNNMHLRLLHSFHSPTAPFSPVLSNSIVRMDPLHPFSHLLAASSAVMNKGAINTCAQVFMWTYFLFVLYVPSV